MLGLVGAPSILIQTGAESWGRFPVPRICRWESRVDTKCPEMKEMCKIRFYNQLPPSDTIINGPWLQKWASSKTVWNPDTGEDTKCLAMEPMCQISFIINCKLLTPFTSGPFLQKWAGSTSVPSPMWNPDTGADSKYPDMKEMCKIMFYIQLPPSESIHKWPWLNKRAGPKRCGTGTLGRTLTVWP